MAKKTDTEDEIVLALGRKIQIKEGVGLLEAIEIAQQRLKPKPKVQDEFTITLKVKPRIARWIIDTFGGHEKFSIEVRLAAYLVPILNRTKVTTIRREADARGKIGRGKAVTIRSEFMEDAK